MKNLIICVLFGLLFVSCSQPIDYEEDYEENYGDGTCYVVDKYYELVQETNKGEQIDYDTLYYGMYGNHFNVSYAYSAMVTWRHYYALWSDGSKRMWLETVKVPTGKLYAFVNNGWVRAN